jgi:PAS domain S-box-containing protein
MRFFRDLPIKRKLTLITIAISGVALLLACGGFAIYEQASARRSMARDYAILANMFGGNVAPGLAFNDTAAMEQVLLSFDANPHIVAACVYDPTGTIVARYRRATEAKPFAFPPERAAGHVFTPDRLDSFQDIVLAGEKIGVVYIGSDLDELSALAMHYALLVVLLLGVCSLVVLGMASWLKRIIADPIVELATTTALVARAGNYSLRARKESDDEVGHLIDGFNEMLAQIQRRDAELEAARDQLEKRVAERTEELERENVERRRAETAWRDSQAMYHSLVEHLPVMVYRRDTGGRFIFANSRYCEFMGRPADEIVGRTVFDLHGGAEAERLASEDGMIVRLGHTLELDESRAGRDGELVHLHSIKTPVFDAQGRIVGTQGLFFDITALKNAQEETARERARFKFIFDSLPVGVAWMMQGEIATRIVNPAHAEISGVPVERCREMALYRAATQPEDRARQDALHARLLAGEIDHYEMEKRYLRPDGEVRWAVLAIRVFHDETSGREQEITTLVDITERKHAEAELARTHKELVASSRQAGMAEVATGVLHNVGNVLNSVNVSATLLMDIARHSRVDRVGKLSGLLAAHAADLAGFLRDDPRGQKVPAFLASLATHLAHENAETLAELDALRKNIEHIKDIVAMQQSYARVSGMSEAVVVTDLVEDALRMNTGSFSRHEITLVRDFRVRPTITVEKHKVLQILVNLIRNAKYACDDSGRADKTVTIRVAGGGDRVQIAVIDNGVGISAENITRIFAHGFTTRKHGHGFGLHSGAIAARELGGALTVHSDGPGCGATFTLELPCQKEISAS